MSTGPGGSAPEPEEAKGTATVAVSLPGSGQANSVPGGELARIGRYRVLDEIASGGMATVHLGYAEDAPPGKFVAIKKMHAHYARDPDFASMFLDEAMVCKYIRHENVVVTLDVVKEGDELLLVLELVDGESLSKVIKPLHARKGRVPRAIVSAIVVDMLRGLHAAHEAKNEAGEPLLIVHRDVSPHNVVVSTEGRARVLDFGVAKARGRVQQTQKGQLKGKLAYMSPEQARGKAVDRRSDVFAAGIVLWELLVGQRLYDHDNEAALLVALISENPVAPSTKDASLADLDALVLKALAIQPDDRYATALEMADAVAATIPPASRTEVATWIKNEARGSLARRQALMTRAQARIARAAARGGLSSAPPPPRSGADAEELPWDVPTTTTDDIKAPKPSVSTPLPRPAAPAARPLHLAAPIPKVEAPVVSRDSDTDEPEATLPLYTPPAEYLEKWKREAESKAAPAATTPPPAPAPAVALPFGPQLPPASTAAPTSSSPHVVPAAFAAQAPSVITPRGVPGSMLETMRISEPPEARAEAVPSQVTSVTLTTTDMPPPLPPEQVRRLTLIGSITAAVAAMVAIAVLVIATKKPWSPKPAETAGRGLGLVQLQAARAGTAAEQAARAAVEPPPAEAVPASAASSAAPAASSAAPAASSAAPPASSAAPPPPRPPQQKAAPSQTSWPPKSTGAAPGKAAPTSTSKPRR